MGKPSEEKVKSEIIMIMLNNELANLLSAKNEIDNFLYNLALSEEEKKVYKFDERWDAIYKRIEVMKTFRSVNRELKKLAKHEGVK